MDMLRITKSRLRKDLLNLYFTNPEKEFYLRDLERVLDYSVANIRRELIKLEKDGLFDTRKRGNLQYYSLNKKYPLYDEFKSIVSKTAGIKWSLKPVLEKIKGIKASFIYGSFAKSEEKQGSDIDVFIIGNVSENLLIDSLARVEKKYQREINYALYNFDDFVKKKRNKNPFILDVLKQPKIFLIGGENDL